MHYDSQEINKFNNLAHHWWNVDGEFKTLHQINPTRTEFIAKHANLKNKSVIDIGCGGGILSEAMSRLGAQVTGIDLAPQLIEIAKLHLFESELEINYECIDVISKAAINAGCFDILTCMEMLEHVPEPELIIANCSRLLKPGGFAFFSTLNRTLKSYALGVVAAEYILKLIPKNTHEYNKFITPAELNTMLAKHELEIVDIKGLDYNPFTHNVKVTKDVSINYMVACKKI